MVPCRFVPICARFVPIRTLLRIHGQSAAGNIPAAAGPRASKSQEKKGSGVPWNPGGEPRPAVFDRRQHLAGAANNKPRLAPASARYTNTPAFDLFRASSGRLTASDADGDRLTYGIVGGRVHKGFSVRTSPLGTLRVNTATGAYTYSPTAKALNAVRPDTVDEFLTTVSDGSSTTQSTFRVQVAPAVSSALPAVFRLGSLAPDNPENVLTDLPARTADATTTRVASRQHYIEFTLEGATDEVRRSDLSLYSNDRLISLRKTRLVKIADEGGRTTYRLFGIPHVSSAKATFTFVVNGPAGGAATTWRRG